MFNLPRRRGLSALLALSLAGAVAIATYSTNASEPTKRSATTAPTSDNSCSMKAMEGVENCPNLERQLQGAGYSQLGPIMTLREAKSQAYDSWSTWANSADSSAPMIEVYDYQIIMLDDAASLHGIFNFECNAPDHSTASQMVADYQEARLVPVTAYRPYSDDLVDNVRLRSGAVIWCSYQHPYAHPHPSGRALTAASI